MPPAQDPADGPVMLVVMPVYNQVDQLGPLLEQCRACPHPVEFYCVDNGCDDGSAELLDASGFRIHRVPKNRGIGYALRQGAEVALDEGWPFVANLAGNGKMVPGELDRLVAPLVSGRADYVTGSRFLDGGQSPHLPGFRKTAIPLVVNNVVRLMLHARLTDATCGFRGYRTDLLRDPRIRWRRESLDRYQFEYYLYAKALRLGYRCEEVPASMIYPASGKNYSKIPPVTGWYQMLEPWFVVGLGLD